jgi:putative endonuclease
VAKKDGVGKYGERVALQHLEDAGFEILARNWRCSEGEIDIVARDRDVLVICEVKTRSGLGFGLPAEAITRTKADRLRLLARRWLQQHPAGGADVRFDVVSVVRAQRGAAVVEHLRAAF